MIVEEIAPKFVRMAVDPSGSEVNSFIAFTDTRYPERGCEHKVGDTVLLCYPALNNGSASYLLGLSDDSDIGRLEGYDNLPIKADMGNHFARSYNVSLDSVNGGFYDGGGGSKTRDLVLACNVVTTTDIMSVMNSVGALAHGNVRLDSGNANQLELVAPRPTGSFEVQRGDPNLKMLPNARSLREILSQLDVEATSAKMIESFGHGRICIEGSEGEEVSVSAASSSSYLPTINISSEHKKYRIVEVVIKKIESIPSLDFNDEHAKDSGYGTRSHFRDCVYKGNLVNYNEREENPNIISDDVMVNICRFERSKVVGNVHDAIDLEGGALLVV